MRQDAADLVIEYPDQLPSPRNFKPDQFLYRQAKCVLLRQRSDIVEPVEIGDRLKIGLGLDQFFGAPMQKTNVRIDPCDDFAVKFEHEPEHAMSGGMLWTEIDGEISKAGRLVRHTASDRGHPSP
jgi:hypothetical protein